MPTLAWIMKFKSLNRFLPALSQKAKKIFLCFRGYFWFGGDLEQAKNVVELPTKSYLQ